MPSLATVEKATAICSGVTAMPWPMGMLAMDVPDQRSAGGMMPAASPGNWIPVRLPKPKA